MAIIGKIRDKSWLILIIVGGALVAFILGDYNKGNAGLEEKYGIGTVYGEKVDELDFNKSLKIAEENNLRSAQQQGQQQPQPVNKDQVWNSFVQDIVLQQEYAILGIEVGPVEFDAYIYGTDGFQVMPDLAESFKDSATGIFNANLLRSRLEEMESSDDPEVQKQWEDTKTYYTEKRKREKYFAILDQGVYVTNLEAKQEYLAQKEVKSISYVLKRFTEIKDEEIEVNDELLKKYFEEHSSEIKYKNKTSVRQLKYVDITLKPSAADTAKLIVELNQNRVEFEAAANDSIFVMRNSGFKRFTSGPYSTALPEMHPNAKDHLTYPVELDSLFNNAQLGTVIGPYESQGTFNVAKVIGFTRDTINARHILLPVEQGNEAAIEARADSIMEVINSGNFTAYVDLYSTDTGSKVKGGELGDFFFSQMTPPFAIYCADAEIGKIGKVRSQFGIHIIEVLDRRGPKHPRLALVQQQLKPSRDTKDEIEKIVYDLLYDLDEKISEIASPEEKIAMFDSIAIQNDLFSRVVEINEEMPAVGGIESTLAQDKLIELAYQEEAKIGDIVTSPVRDNNRYVLAVLSSIKVKDEVSFESVKKDVEIDFIKAEKAKIIEGELAKSKTLEGLTSGGTATIQNAEVTFANPQITGAGYEPDVIGALFSALKDGETTAPIIGKQGVYVIRVEKTTPAQTTDTYDTEKAQLLGAAKGKTSGAAGRALVEKADVIDNRKFRQIGLRR